MKISGAGCCLIDSIYMDCSYQDEAYTKLWSKEPGDGGLIEGGLVFSEELQKFANRPYSDILEELTKGREPDVVNLGGPAVVALVHASQILAEAGVEVSFHGAVGKDELANRVRDAVKNTPLKTYLKEVAGERTATTEVFDDPTQRDGKGERSFINTIGAAGYFGSNDLADSFYDADLILLGGTALVPQLHDELATVLAKAKERGIITVVGTVYDFRNERANPGQRWPLGSDEAYKNIDLLLVDEEEALKLSGKTEIFEAAHELIRFGVGALIITRGALDMLVYSTGKLIAKHELASMPVNTYIDDLMRADPSLRKDTTGCGDNFVGGALVALATHFNKKGPEQIEMREICAWGATSGGYTCMYHGGTYHEKEVGEKARLLQPALEAYRQMTEGM
ncbi:MAG: carbohydrate kinase family protein [Sphaerochaetaceae bacterium]|jgi:sugar/nucleoside kinase (ribokinase family)|nr:PfkB family carbohydrate kinase [Sphaerochaetaceae bacterium]HHU87996.1 carbohydrate kinase family protein [Spirochaetales bacterium]